MASVFHIIIIQQIHNTLVGQDMVHTFLYGLRENRKQTNCHLYIGEILIPELYNISFIDFVSSGHMVSYVVLFQLFMALKLSTWAIRQGKKVGP